MSYRKNPKEISARIYKRRKIGKIAWEFSNRIHEGMFIEVAKGSKRMCRKRFETSSQRNNEHAEGILEGTPKRITWRISKGTVEHFSRDNAQEFLNKLLKDSIKKII